ncbi:MAG: hypothetical protein KTR31_36280 [Myxococcales bacterium]|nr:hypothetical protein [Myxococcales bacterium]
MLLIHGPQIEQIATDAKAQEGRVGQVRFVQGARVEQRTIAPTSDAHMRVVHGTQVTSVPAAPVGGPKLRLIHGARVQDRPVDDKGCLRDEVADSCTGPTATTPTNE